MNFKKLIQNAEWWKFTLLSLCLCFLLFVIGTSCNPAILAMDKFKSGITNEVLKESAPELNPFLGLLIGKFLDNLSFPLRTQASLFGLLSSFVFLIIIPILSSLFFALFSHLILMIGGAPGGWRMTFKSFSLHRVFCDGATLLLLILALNLQAHLTLVQFLLIVFLPLIRFGSLIFLWINLAQTHSLGPMRVIFLGIPHIVTVSFFSIIVSELIAFWFCLYIIVGSIH
jgi:hypothetical protein